MNVVFFNHYHNGDIHVSRGFIRYIMNRIPGNYFYSHANPQNLLADIPNLLCDPNAIKNIKDNDNIIKINDTIYINTWYGQQNRKYLNSYGISFDALYTAFNDNCKQLWNFSLNEVSDPTIFFPSIDYSKFEIGLANKWLDLHPAPKILVENGYAKSGQAHNFNMTEIIAKIAKVHKDKIFILSSKEHTLQLNNVFYTSDIINKKNKSDLNEISFLGMHCDIIVGRASGVFTFSLTQENLFKRKIKYLCFSNLVTPPNKFWLGPLMQNKINYNSSIAVNNTSNVEEVLSIIENAI